MERYFVFIYSKEGKIKVLNLEKSKKEHDDLILDGWVHSSTLDPCVWIAHLYNYCDDEIDVLKEVIDLGNH